MKQILAVLLSAIVIVLNYSCNSTEPEKTKFKHPHDMTWTADTISYPGSAQTMMESMWASSPNDVWITGHNDASKGNLWHYKGTKWDEVDLSRDIERTAKSLTRVGGISSNNIWVVGDRIFNNPLDVSKMWYSDLVLQYNGNRWIEHKQNTASRILALFCNDPFDIWIGGDNGYVANYDGTKWMNDTISIKFNGKYFINGITKYKNEVLAIVSAYSPSANRYYYVKGSLNNWRIVDSIYYNGTNFNVKWGYYGLFKSPANKIYSYGPGGVWEWNGNQWVQVLKINNTFKGLFALNESYVFAVGDSGLIYFYDGTNWSQLSNFTSSQTVIFTDAWSNGQETFILGHTTGSWPQKTIIWHGK